MATQTHTGTNTRVTVALVVAGLLGLAAYGFAFFDRRTISTRMEGSRDRMQQSVPSLMNPDQLLSFAAEELVGSVYIGCSSKWNASAPLINFSQTTPVHPIQLNAERFVLESTDGGMVVGSKGTKYFSNIVLVNNASSMVVMGPIELPAPKSAKHAMLNLQDAFTQPVGSLSHYTLQSPLGCTEDVPGEFFGHHYRVVKKAIMDGDAMDLSTGLSVSSSQVSPQGEIVGPTFQVVAP